MNSNPIRQSLKRLIRDHLVYSSIILIIIFAISVIIVYFSIAPTDFPNKITITIERNVGLNGAADELAEKGIIKSTFVYKAFVVFLGGSKRVMAGDYLFDSPQSALRVAYRTVHGIQGLAKIKITIPEGLAVSDIARLLKKDIPQFDDKTFVESAKVQEGYLFPDTYFFYENVKPAQIIEEMRANFDRRTKELSVQLIFSGHSMDEITKMASIIEEEARSEEDRKIIAGILWKRIDDKMPLQVDAPFFYILGKTSAELTTDDLAMDSPYNLYKNLGLPPTPISNPGLDAIEAALNPTKTEYWFYLSDRDGNMHFAKTHDEHVANKRKYL